MFKFIDKPNLPENKVAHCVINEKAVQAINYLNNSGVHTLKVSENDLLENEIAAHADLHFLYCGKELAVIAPNQTLLIEEVKELGCRVEVAEFTPFSPYPNDVLLNQAFINDYLLLKTDSTSKKVLELIADNEFRLINTKQGYAKCSVCIVSDKAIITEDNGIATLLKNYQFDVLKIKSDCIHLSDKHFGFLGGASGKISKNEIFFNGNLEEHPDFLNIKSFLNNYNIVPVYSKTYKLTDIGSIIPVTEICK